MSSSGTAWARQRGRHRVEAESGGPARREEPSGDEHAQLVSHGGRSEAVPREEPSADAWLRRGSGEGGTVWERTVSEGEE